MNDDVPDIRDAIEKKRTVLTEMAGELRTKLGDIERELSAIDAYKRIISGVTNAIAANPNSVSKSSGRGRKPEQGGTRDQVAAIIAEFGPITRAEILEKMGRQGDDRAAIAVSNALVKLRGMGIVERDETNKKYRALKLT